MSLFEIILLLVTGLIVGVINTLAGGATIISLSVLMFLGLPPNVANATHRIAALFQTFVSTSTFRKEKVLDFKKALYLGIPTAFGSLIGAYIAEYELRGMDRATYGDNLLIELANSLTTVRISNCNRRQLYRYLRFYRLYPSIVGTLSPQLKELLPAKMQAIGKAGTLSPQLHFPPEQGVAMLSSQEVMILTSQNAISRSGHRR